MDHSDRMHLFGEEGTDDGVNKLHLMHRNRYNKLFGAEIAQSVIRRITQ